MVVMVIIGLQAPVCRAMLFTLLRGWLNAAALTLAGVIRRAPGVI